MSRESRSFNVREAIAWIEQAGSAGVIADPLRRHLRLVNREDLTTGSCATGHCLFAGIAAQSRWQQWLLFANSDNDRIFPIAQAFYADPFVDMHNRMKEALALLGERPKLMGTAGQDFGEYRQWLEAARIDTSISRLAW